MTTHPKHHTPRSPKWRADQRHALRERLREIERHPEEPPRERGEISLDEQPILETARAVEGRVSAMEGAEHQLILDALQRLENETYGFCQTCGKQIANLRLKAIPWAAECARCARSHDGPPIAPADFEHGKDRLRQAGASLSELLGER